MLFYLLYLRSRPSSKAAPSSTPARPNTPKCVGPPPCSTLHSLYHAMICPPSLSIIISSKCTPFARLFRPTHFTIAYSVVVQGTPSFHVYCRSTDLWFMFTRYWYFSDSGVGYSRHG